MTFKKISLIFVLALLLSLYNLPQNAGKEEGEKSYNIGPRDLLDISVFNVPELNITVRVSEDGTISLPLLGNIKVEGYTRFLLEEHLAALLEKNYLRNARVSVFIKEYQSKIISIIGAVKKPGIHEMLGEKTLLELFSLAGGLDEKVSDRVIILRKLKNGGNISLIINLNELMLKGNPKLNIPLRSGDIVNVPPERFMNIYLFGEVNKPGHIKMVKDGEITLLRAIAQAGGFSERARKSSVLVKRKVDGKEIKIKINVKKILRGKKSDFVLKNNDIIHVPESVL